MRVLIVFFFISSVAFSQTTGQVWTEIGLKYKQNSKIDYGLDINSRFDNTGVASFFPQLSFKYEVTKWFRPSIDYRFTMDKDKYTNFLPENRIQVNANFEKHLNKRVKVDARVRYQYNFSRWTNDSGFEQSLSNVMRFRPQVSYDLKDNFLTPYINGELFYKIDPVASSLYKMRIGAGFDLEIDSPFSISFGYIYDRELNDKNRNPKIRHIASISVKYKLN